MGSNKNKDLFSKSVKNCCSHQCCVCRCLVKNSSAVIELQLDRPVCIELYKDYKALGRFMLRYAGSTIAAGLITEVSATPL